MVRNLLNLFSNKIVSLVANTTISDSIISRMLRTMVADSIYFNKSSLTKTATAKPIFIESAERSNQYGAGLSVRVINFVASTLRAGSIYKIKSEFADTSLLIT